MFVYIMYMIHNQDFHTYGSKILKFSIYSGNPVFEEVHIKTTFLNFAF